jgi:hypothetical protein
LADEVNQKFKDEQITKSSIGGVIFLRFVCPALATPASANLLAELPPKKAGRTLMLLSKILQNLANGVQFGQKEEFMKSSNTYLEKKEKEVYKYLLSIIVRK